mgnify:CR=1 FL=1
MTGRDLVVGETMIVVITETGKEGDIDPAPHEIQRSRRGERGYEAVISIRQLSLSVADLQLRRSRLAVMAIERKSQKGREISVQSKC